MSWRLLLLWLVIMTLPKPAPCEDDDTVSIGGRFHHETSFGDDGLKGENAVFGERVPLYKEYEGAKKTKLSLIARDKSRTDEIIERRRSTRVFSGQTLGLDYLARVLLSGNGVTHSKGAYEMRSAPSAGALYPIDIYVIAYRVDSLEKGLYHFQVQDSSLALIKAGDFNEDIYRACNNQKTVGFSPATLILTARFDRSTIKYADRGYRYCYMESGAIAENVHIQAEALGLGTVIVGAFNDDAVSGLLDVDGVSEAPMIIMPLGWPR